MPAFDHVVIKIPRGEKRSIAHVASQLLVAPVVVLLPEQYLIPPFFLLSDLSETMVGGLLLATTTGESVAVVLILDPAEMAEAIEPGEVAESSRSELTTP